MAAEHELLDFVGEPAAVLAGAQPVEVPDGAPAAAAAGQHGRQSMRWTNVMSGFVLRRFCQLISTGVRTDKGFKEVHLNQVARDLHEFTGNEVTGTQVYNHLRKWRQRWIRVTKLRELSGALWDEDNMMITLEEEHYKGHVKAHPKDADLLNKPIENYQQMQVIFGNGLATGKFAMGSSEPLGCPSDFAESSLKAEDCKSMFGEPSTKGQEAAGGAGSGGPGSSNNKRKRCMVSDEDMNVMSGMTAAVNNVADAIRSTRVEDSHPGLYDAVMFMPGFTEEALIVAYSHLLDNRAHGNAFVGMTDAHLVLWLRTFLAKHYYA
ncbi:hypothetical protein EJB05_07352 [Eragrostis curvula]|uniref:Myb/SANT-like domain-containing protein n=1 Tax=Eragrostis curvula TaxID=38414 RepID=A0A5J9WI54_9POAL|nr:hypothetical protein EJB05_07352 [Eragrostis curvula]